jgi:hypothetical protein
VSIVPESVDDACDAIFDRRHLEANEQARAFVPSAGDTSDGIDADVVIDDRNRLLPDGA